MDKPLPYKYANSSAITRSRSLMLICIYTLWNADCHSKFFRVISQDPSHREQIKPQTARLLRRCHKDVTFSRRSYKHVVVLSSSRNHETGRKLSRRFRSPGLRRPLLPKREAAPEVDDWGCRGG